MRAGTITMNDVDRIIGEVVTSAQATLDMLYEAEEF